MESPAVEVLLRRAQAGDADALGQVVVAHDDRLRRIARLRLDSRLARRVDVDDVLQDVHVEALARLPEFLVQREVPLLIWLRFLTVQRCLALARRHLGAEARDVRREQPLDVGGPDATSVALASALEGSVTTPSRAVARDETQARVRDAVQALEPFDREILCLRNFEELDNAETAAVLGIERAAAGKRYVRALGRLRDALGSAGLDLAERSA